MKRIVLFFVVALVSISVSAQPKKTIIEVQVSPEHADWQYRCGQDAKFNVTVLKAGVPLENTSRYPVLPTLRTGFP